MMLSLTLIPFILYWGFIYYATCLREWTTWTWYMKLLAFIPAIPIWLSDVIFNLFFGSLIYLQLPLAHGLTFSKSCSYWLHQPNSTLQYNEACWWANKLNRIIPGHIT